MSDYQHLFQRALESQNIDMVVHLMRAMYMHGASDTLRRLHDGDSAQQLVNEINDMVSEILTGAGVTIN